MQRLQFSISNMHVPRLTHSTGFRCGQSGADVPSCEYQTHLLDQARLTIRESIGLMCQNTMPKHGTLVSCFGMLHCSAGDKCVLFPNHWLNAEAFPCWNICYSLVVYPYLSLFLVIRLWYPLMGSKPDVRLANLPA